MTPEIAALICDVIRLDGLADHYAGALAGVRRATLERWKAEDAGFALMLERARGEFEWKLIQQIRNACKRDGTPDWRALAWVLKHVKEDGIVQPGRATREGAREPASAAAKNGANRPETPATPRAGAAPTTAAAPAPTERCAHSRENAAFLPETPARPGPQVGRGAPLSGRIAPVGENVSIRPETPGAV